METTTTPAPKYNTIVHTELASSNPEETQGFLKNVFGWTFENAEGPMPYTFVNTSDGSTIGGLRPVNEEEPGPSVTNYILVEDIDATAETITQNGGTIVVPVQTIPDMGKMLWFQMPGGCIMACWQDLS